MEDEAGIDEGAATNTHLLAAVVPEVRKPKGNLDETGWTVPGVSLPSKTAISFHSSTTGGGGTDVARRKTEEAVQGIRMGGGGRLHGTYRAGLSVLFPAGAICGNRKDRYGPLPCMLPSWYMPLTRVLSCS